MVMNLNSTHIMPWHTILLNLWWCELWSLKFSQIKNERRREKENKTERLSLNSWLTYFNQTTKMKRQTNCFAQVEESFAVSCIQVLIQLKPFSIYYNIQTFFFFVEDFDFNLRHAMTMYCYEAMNQKRRKTSKQRWSREKYFSFRSKNYLPAFRS